MALMTMQVEDFKKLVREQISVEIKLFKRQFLKNHNSDILLRKEAADLLKCDLTTLWEWTVAGYITAYGLGKKRVYYLKSELIVSIKNNKLKIAA